MNNSKAVIMLIVAIIAGIGAVTMASRWLIDRSTNVNKIAVATVDINLGQKLTQDMVKLVEWPASSIPTDSFTEASKLDGRVLKTSLQRGEPLMESKLAPVGTQGGLSAVIAEGKRAITVRVNDVVGVAGFALPGNYVDIIVNTQQVSTQAGNGNNEDQNISKIVLERILVLAVAQEVGRDETKPKVVNAVTLEVTPEQAEYIDLARSIGSLSLVLRNQVDPNLSVSAGATKNTLLNIVPVAAPAPIVVAAKPVKPKIIIKRVAAAKPAVPVVIAKRCSRVINGLSESLECF